MKILLTGATGYIGKRLLPVLVSKGYDVVCCVRDKNRFNPPKTLEGNIEIIEVDFLDRSTLDKIPKDIDAAYYLIHSMSTSKDYQELELKSAKNFKDAIKNTQVKHVVYLSGIVNDNSLSKHLTSRKAVEEELGIGSFNFTTLRAGIIIGSGSASFEIIRDLVEKLPVMVTPIWLKTQSQPIGITDVVTFLDKTLFNDKTYNKSFDIGGPDILSYRELLMGYAKARGLNRWIYIVPVMTPKLSSYWLYFITSTSFKLASALVSSMKVEVICKNDDLNQLLNVTPESYEISLRKTIADLEDGHIVSSWKDSLISGRFDLSLSDFFNVPTHGCFVDKRTSKLVSRSASIEKIWRIGGKTGWYYANWLWKLRGLLDKVWGGIGLRRGRTNLDTISPGDVIDFWRVLYADKEEGRLLLFAEMKLPGEAWLEFRIKNNLLIQIATFRPKGLWGRIYWYAVYPFHGLIFKGMIKKISQ